LKAVAQPRFSLPHDRALAIGLYFAVTPRRLLLDRCGLAWADTAEAIGDPCFHRADLGTAADVLAATSVLGATVAQVFSHLRHDAEAGR